MNMRSPAPLSHSPSGVEALPVVHVAQLPETPPTTPWLIEGLWPLPGVGILGACPKSFKTWLALDVAVSVASGTRVMGHFPVLAPGKCLVYAAEDSVESVRRRIADIAGSRGLTLQQLDLGLLAIPSLRLDTPRDLARLRATLADHRPRLLVLDPLVRIHKLDENSAGEVSALLGELRQMQRQYDASILLVHHLRKSGASSSQPGQALRGSGDLHAWGDVNLFLQRKAHSVSLAIEHRCAPSPPPLLFTLEDAPTPHLAPHTDQPAMDEPSLTQRLLDYLAAANAPVDRETLRQELRTRNQNLGQILVQLRSQGRIERCNGGFRTTQAHPPIPVPSLRDTPDGNAPASP